LAASQVRDLRSGQRARVRHKTAINGCTYYAKLGLSHASILNIIKAVASPDGYARPSPFQAWIPIWNIWPLVNRSQSADCGTGGDALTPQLYLSTKSILEKRIYSGWGQHLLVGRADVSVQRPRTPPRPNQRSRRPFPTEPSKVTVPLTEEVREAYPEVKAAKAGDYYHWNLVPTNKQGEDDRNTASSASASWEARLISSNRSLRAGDPLPVVEDLPQSHYRILVVVLRSAQRQICTCSICWFYSAFPSCCCDQTIKKPSWPASDAQRCLRSLRLRLLHWLPSRSVTLCLKLIWADWCPVMERGCAMTKQAVKQGLPEALTSETNFNRT